jgi:hypothetical protein
LLQITVGAIGGIIMKRPGFGSIFWFLAFAAVLILFLRQSPLSTQSSPSTQPPRNASEDMIFGIKAFSDNPQNSGGFVSISGTLTGDGVGHKNNTVNVSCYKDRFECLISSIEQIASNQLGSLYPPINYPITKWDAY